jgi:hypothetical protein
MCSRFLPENDLFAPQQLLYPMALVLARTSFDQEECIMTSSRRQSRSMCILRITIPNCAKWHESKGPLYNTKQNFDHVTRSLIT